MNCRFQGALDAIDAAERCVATIRRAAAASPEGYVAAMGACREALNDEKLPSVVRERVVALVLSILDCVTEARAAGNVATVAAFSGCAPVLLRVVGVASCLSVCVAFFFTPWQYVAVVPLGFALSILGFGAPLKAVVRALRRR